MTNWCDKRTVKAQFARYIENNGWKLYGVKEDKSDSMTDYYDPETWDGLATKNGYTLCVDILPGTYSGKTPTKSVWTDDGECAHCHGSGDDPSGWTLEKARETPREYNAFAAGPGCFMLLQNVVSPIPFKSGGALQCTKCHGKGRKMHHDSVNQPELQWPAFQATPGRRVWHVEKDGKILASGTGLWAIADCNHHLPKVKTEQNEKFAKLLTRIEAPLAGTAKNTAAR